MGLGSFPAVVAISDLLSRRRFRALGIFREFFRRFGVEDQIAVPCAASRRHVAGFNVQRAAWSFTEREHELLELARPHLAQARRNARAWERAQTLLRAANAGLEYRTSGVIVLGAGQRIQAVAGQALALLWDDLGPRPPFRELPERVRAWLAQERPRRAVGLVPPTPLVVGRDDGRRVVIWLLPDRVHGREVLLLEAHRTAMSVDLLRPLGLSPRETEVLRWVVEGKSNSEIAILLEVSLPTVKKHLEHIYAKLGVESRHAAAARAREIASLRSP